MLTVRRHTNRLYLPITAIKIAICPEALHTSSHTHQIGSIRHFLLEFQTNALIALGIRLARKVSNEKTTLSWASPTFCHVANFELAISRNCVTKGESIGKILVTIKTI